MHWWNTYRQEKAQPLDSSIDTCKRALFLQEYRSELCELGCLQHIEHLCPWCLWTCGLCVAFTSTSILCQGAEPIVSKECTIIKTTNISLLNNHFVAESQSPFCTAAAMLLSHRLDSRDGIGIWTLPWATGLRLHRGRFQTDLKCPSN